MPDVLINFKVNYDQLDSALDVLEKTGQVDAKVAQSFKATNQAITQQGVALQKTAQSFKGPITSLDQLDKRSKKFVDEFIKGFEQGVKAELLSAKKELDLLRNKLSDTGKTGDKALKDLEKELKSVKTELSENNKELEKLKEKYAKTGKEGKDGVLTLKQELKGLTVAIAEAKAAGSPIDPKTIQRAGELKDAIADANAEIKDAGSDTKGLDNLIGTVQAVTGGFAVLQGSAALFGDESEDMQKTLLRVNAAMSVLQGLQSIQNALQKEGAISQALANAQRSIAVVQTNLQTAAESKNVVVKNLATIAQRALNAAMAANPIALIITALIAVIGYLIVYTKNTREAAEATGELRGSVKNLGEELDKSSDAISRNTEREIIDLKKARAEESKIIQARIDGLSNQTDAIQAAYDRGKAILDKGLGDAEEREKLVAALDAKRKQLIDNRIQLQQLELDKEKQIESERKAMLEERKRREQEAADRAKQRLSDQIDLLKAERTTLDENTKAYAEITLTINRLQTAMDNLGQSIARQTLNWAENKVAAKDAVADIQNSITGGFQNALNKTKGAVEEVANQMVDVGGAATGVIEGGLEDTEDKYKDFVNGITESTRGALQVMSTIGQGLNQLSQERQQNQQIEIENSRKEVDSLLDAGAITEKEAEARQKRIDRLEAQQKAKAAQQAKELAIFQAIISTLQAATQALTAGPIIGPILAAAITALGVANVNAIRNRPIPKFATGKKGTYEGMGIVGEAGAELVVQGGRMFVANKATPIYLGAQDKVYTANETRRILPYVDKAAMMPLNGNGNDLKRLIAAMPRPQSGPSINIDKDFITEAVREGLNTTNYFNKRYRR